MIKTTTTSASHSPNQLKAPSQIARITHSTCDSIDKVAMQFMQLFAKEPLPLISTPTQLTLAIHYAKLLYECAMKKNISSELPAMTSEKVSDQKIGYQGAAVSLLFSPCQKKSQQLTHNDYAHYALSNLTGLKPPRR